MPTMAPTEGMSQDELRAARKARSEQYGIPEMAGGSLTFPADSPTDPELYGDPVNLAYPLDTPERARNAAARAAQFLADYPAPARAVVFERIVRAEMGHGAKPEPSPEMMKLLPADLRKELEPQHEEMGEIPRLEVFDAGTYRGKPYTTADIDRVVVNFNAFAATHKVPLVIGHSEDQRILRDSGLPAAGWATRAWREGTKLIASFADVPRQVADLIARRAYRRVSAEIYENLQEKGASRGMALRRVALLGGDVPEVKTLGDVVALYAEGGPTVWVGLAEDTTMADPNAPVTPDPKVADLEKKFADLENRIEAAEAARSTSEKHFAEAQTARTAAEAKLAEAETKLAETAKRLDEAGKAVAAHETRFTEADAERRRFRVEGTIADAIRAGRVTPAMRDRGLQPFMEALASAGGVVKFSEGGKDVERPLIAHFEEFLKGLPPYVRLQETARVRASTPSGGQDGSFPDTVQFSEGQTLPVDDRSRAVNDRALELMGQKKFATFKEALRAAGRELAGTAVL